MSAAQKVFFLPTFLLFIFFYFRAEERDKSGSGSVFAFRQKKSAELLSGKFIKFVYAVSANRRNVSRIADD